MSVLSVYLTKEHELFRKEVRDFLKEKVIPDLELWERQGFVSREIWGIFGDMNWLGMHYPKHIGGSEKDLFYSLVLLEEISKIGYAGFRVAIAVHAYMATTYLALESNNDHIKQNYLLPAIMGKKIGALAITEAQAGSDLSLIQTTALLNGDNYIVNGSKKFVANGTISDFIILAVKTRQEIASDWVTGLSIIVVDTNTVGLSRKKLDMLGWHSSNTAEIHFENVSVPVKNTIGKTNQGFIYLMKNLQLERLVAGILALGSVEYCLDITWQYMKKRQIYAKTLSKLQTLKHKLAHFATELEASRQLAYHAAWLYQHAQLPITECSMVKLKATELAKKAAEECILIFGASGYQNNNPISRVYREALASTFAAGSNEIMKDIIAEEKFEFSNRSE